MKKINNGVLNSYIISIIFLGLYLLFDIFCFFESNLAGEFVSMLFLSGVIILFYISFIISIILGIINFIKNKDVRKKIIIMFSILFVISVGVQTIPDLIATHISQNIKSKVHIAVNPIVEKVKNDSKNKYVYFLEDLQKLDNNFFESPFGNTYDSASYITNYDGQIYVSLFDGKKLISGNIDNLKVSKINTSKDSYTYSFSENEGEIYIKNHIEELYDIKVKNVSCVFEYSLFSAYISHYDVTTNAGTFKSDVDVVDNKIIIEDDYLSLSENDRLLGQVKDFTENHLNIDNLNSSKEFSSISFLENNDKNIICIHTNQSKNDSKKYAEALSNQLSKNTNNAKIMIVKYNATADENSNTISDYINSIDVKTDHVIYITIKDGKVTIE